MKVERVYIEGILIRRNDRMNIREETSYRSVQKLNLSLFQLLLCLVHPHTHLYLKRRQDKQLPIGHDF